MQRKIFVVCVDRDNDGYCDWGISETMPETCPNSCYSEKDCDDSSAYLGPFDANFNCMAITTCQEDVNDDGFINASDLKQVLLKHFHLGNFLEDINRDGLVNSIDASRIISHWNEAFD